MKAAAHFHSCYGVTQSLAIFPVELLGVFHNFENNKNIFRNARKKDQKSQRKYFPPKTYNNKIAGKHKISSLTS
jgi:hypothetical protein